MTEVNAAGGVVVKHCDGTKLMLLVHRPRYDDWSFPKGKLDQGETFEQGALREVWEETGLRCSMVRELSPVQYRDRFDRPKTVRYWLMRTEDGGFEPNEEVDEIAWVEAERAREMLSYPHDVSLVDELTGQDL